MNSTDCSCHHTVTSTEHGSRISSGWLLVSAPLLGAALVVLAGQGRSGAAPMGGADGIRSDGLPALVAPGPSVIADSPTLAAGDWLVSELGQRTYLPLVRARRTTGTPMPPAPQDSACQITHVWDEGRDGRPEYVTYSYYDVYADVTGQSRGDEIYRQHDRSWGRIPADGVVDWARATQYEQPARPIRRLDDRDNDGFVDAVGTLVYDGAGNRIREEGDADLDGRPDELIHYTYAITNGKLIALVFDWDADGQPEEVTRFGYDALDRYVREEWDYNGDGEVDWVVTYYWDDRGFLVRAEHLGTYVETTRTDTYTYDEQTGRLVELCARWATERVRCTFRQDYRYDEAWELMVHIDDYRRDFLHDWADYRYDDRGRMVEWLSGSVVYPPQIFTQSFTAVPRRPGPGAARRHA